MGHYRRAQAALIRRQETTELTSVEKSMLRNCCFSVGNVLFDLGQYDDAVKAYSVAGNRYQEQAIEHGAAQYNPQTAEFEWKADGNECNSR